MELAKALIVKEADEDTEISQAMKKFEDTQKILSENLKMGELGVANSLVKTHEIEFRKHGMFEKDNRQKQAPITVSISLDAPAEKGAVIIDGQATQLS